MQKDQGRKKTKTGRTADQINLIALPLYSSFKVKTARLRSSVISPDSCSGVRQFKSGSRYLYNIGVQTDIVSQDPPPKIQDVVTASNQTMEALRQSSVTAHMDITQQVHEGYKKALGVLQAEIVRLRELCDKHNISHINTPNRAARRQVIQKQDKAVKKAKK